MEKDFRELLSSCIEESNVSRYSQRDGIITITLKDSSLVDLQKIQSLLEDESVSMNRNKIRISLSNKEEGLRMANNFKETAAGIIKLVGGKENITYCTHCVTRIRLNLKDKGLVNVEGLKSLEGTLGAQWAGEQLQVIIGPGVDKVYEETCSIAGIAMSDAINENLDTGLKDRSLKGIGNAILDALSGCLTPIIPMLIVSAMFKTILAVCGPNLLNVLSDTSDIYTLCNFVGDAAFYFLPIAVGYTSAKKFKVTPILGILMGGILIHPTFAEIGNTVGSFTIFGIPCLAQSYASSIFPALLSVWVMSYVERFFNKYTPSVLKTVFAPFLTILVMLPLSFCILAPAGHYIGEYLSMFFLWMGNAGGIGKIIGIAVVAALWQFLVMSGMHWLLITTTMVVMAETGQESFVLAASCSAFTVGGMCLGVFLREKDNGKKSVALSCIIAQILGGITEPGLFGVGFQYGRPLLGMMAGGLAGGLYAGITKLTAYQIVPVGNFLSLLDFLGNGNANFINGIVAAVIAFVVAAAVTYILGIEKKKA